jgi:hypothetical protein
MRTHLVTGAAGFIGSHLAERLVAEGHAVRGVDCFTDYYPRTDKEANLEGLRREPRFELVEADLAETDSRRCPAASPRVPPGRPGKRAPPWGKEFSPTRGTTSSPPSACSRPKDARLGRGGCSSSSVYGDLTTCRSGSRRFPGPSPPTA